MSSSPRPNIAKLTVDDEHKPRVYTHQDISNMSEVSRRCFLSNLNFYMDKLAYEMAEELAISRKDYGLMRKSEYVFGNVTLSRLLNAYDTSTVKNEMLRRGFSVLICSDDGVIFTISAF